VLILLDYHNFKIKHVGFSPCDKPPSRTAATSGVLPWINHHWMLVKTHITATMLTVLMPSTKSGEALLTVD